MKKPGNRKTLFAVLCSLLVVQAQPPVILSVSERTVIYTHPPMTPSLAERLKHLTLDDAIDIALHRNPNILNQLQEIQRQQGIVVEVRAQLLPHLILTGDFNQTDRKLLSGGGGSTSNGTTTGGTVTTGSTGAAGGTTGTNIYVPTVDSTGTTQTGVLNLSSAFGSSESANQRSYNVTIEVQQTLYNAALLPQYRQARFQRDNAYYALRETVDTTVNQVKQFFYDELLQQETIRLLESQLRDQQNRFAAGTVPRFDVLQASVAVANQRPLLITAQNNFSLGYIGLARAIGVEYGPNQQQTSPIKLVGNLDYHPQDFSPEAGVAAAKAHRAILKEQRQNILIQVDQIRFAAAGYQPVVTASGGYEVENSRLSQDLTDQINGYFFGANINWNIFDGLATYGRVKQARATLAQAKVTYDDAVRGVVQEVQSNFLALQQNKQLIASQIANVGQAEEAVRLSQARLSAGAGTQLDVLQSQQQLTAAQTTELQARHDYAVALANYDRVTATSTVYEETFDDPLTRKERQTGNAATTGAATNEKRQKPASVVTPAQGKRGSGKAARKKINAEHPDRDVNPTLQTGDSPQTNRTPKTDIPLQGYNQH